MTPQSSSPTSIRTSTTATTKNTGQPPATDKLEKIISKCKARGLTTLVDYLANKARKSRRTAVSFWFGLEHLNRFIEQNYKGYNIETVLPTLKTEAKVKNKIDVYKLLDGFISYLQNDSRNGHNLTPKSIHNYMTAARSYFQYNDIDISPSKFKYRISLPPLYREDEEAIDSNDIKEILHHCDNRRLKAYLLVLASGGMRAIEALGIRECDIDFSGINFAVPNDTANPAGIRIRKEFAKSRTERHIFISNEAARFLHNWIEWKYRDRHLENKRLVNRVRSKDDLVFSRIIYTSKYPMGLYTKMLVEFQKVLKLAGFNGRKEDGVYKRRKITFHSFRRFVKTTIANQTRNSDYSEWFLGHKKNTYYVNKPDELRRIYKDECMKYLTFLDYPTLEATGKGYEAKLKEKDKEIGELRRRDKDNAERITMLEAKIDDLYNEWEATVRDETEMVRKLPDVANTEIIRKNTEAAQKALQSTALVKENIIRYLNTTRGLADKTREISHHKQMTDEQKIRYLSSIIEGLSNAAAEAETVLVEGKSSTEAKPE